MDKNIFQRKKKKEGKCVKRRENLEQDWVCQLAPQECRLAPSPRVGISAYFVCLGIFLVRFGPILHSKK